jgi:hypothetical protein
MASEPPTIPAEDEVWDVWASTHPPYPAAGTPAERWLFLLHYAVLAPSIHNTQPWLFALQPEALELHADRSLALPVVDPEDREQSISCGAALLHLRLALQHFGAAGEVTIVPEPGRPDVLARVLFGAPYRPSEEDDELFYAMPQRRTFRYRFDERAVPAPILSDLQGAAQREGAWLHVVEEDHARAALGALIDDAERQQWADPRFRRELAAWLHPNRSRKRDGMPGAALGLGDVASVAGSLVVRTFDWGGGQAARDHQLAAGSPVLAVLGTADDTPAAWVSAGQALARVLLTACARGLSASFLNQPVQLPERRPLVGRTVGTEGWPQIILRLGYGWPIPPTPRRTVHEVLL